MQISDPPPPRTHTHKKKQTNKPSTLMEAENVVEFENTLMQDVGYIGHSKAASERPAQQT